MAKTEDFLLPKMGESITEGTILNWLVQPGEAFDEGSILVEVGTDKVDNEVPAPHAGVLEEHLVPAGEMAPVGAPIARYTPTEGSTTLPIVTKKDVVKDNSSTKKQKQKTYASAPQKVKAPVVNTDLFVSPLVDKIAREHHLSYEELARIPASGHNNRLRKSDVMTYLEEGRPYQFVQPTTATADPTAYRIPQLQLDKGKGRVVEMDRMRSMIADHMVYSKHTSPHVTAFVEADLTEVVNFRNSEKENFLKTHGYKLTFTPLFIHAVAKAIADFPMINSSLDGDKIIVKEEINIGMATALPTGNLIVPVVKNAGDSHLPELAQQVNYLAQKARENKLSGDDIKGSTFTISNVGTFGSLMGTPIINQPEAAILATGIIKKRAEVITVNGQDEIAIRQMMMLSLSFDHRLVDGYLAGSFLKRVADYMEQIPANELLYPSA